jgi:hypothetical protein
MLKLVCLFDFVVVVCFVFRLFYTILGTCNELDQFYKKTK